MTCHVPLEIGNRRLWRIALVSLTAFALFAVGGCRQAESSADVLKKRVLVLGFDGMDPDFLSRFVREGKMPHFKSLMDRGSYSKLQTSIPPQSPVAWSNFITGMNPGGHGIFDFIHRDPATLIPYLSTSKTEGSGRNLRLGDWIIPLSRGKVTLLRHGKSFWEALEERHIPARIIRVPANFPPVDVPVIQLSGMGTPDIQGTYGTFSYYTDEPVEKYKDISGGKVYPVRVAGQRVDAKLYGPRNTLRKGSPQAAVEFSVFVDPQNGTARIDVQGRSMILNQGEWSDWVRIKFQIIPLFQSVSGICRFYLKEVDPGFKLYVTPINIDPAAPALPISIPGEYVKELYEEIGPFYTQGIPEDTKALSGNVLNDAEFLSQADSVLEEELRMLSVELNRFKNGVLFFYIGRVDQLSHMFWRTMDPKHPAYDPKNTHGNVIERAYRDMDAVLGKAMKRMDDDTTLIVLSDHGFAPFYRAFNLNTWLREQGYAYLLDSSEGDLLQNVDWTRTRAYGIGFNSLYLNLKGREKRGIVSPGAESAALLDEISKKLLQVRDPKTGYVVVTKVYQSTDVFSGAYAAEAPELIVGYNRGYRSSWETVLGKFPQEVIRDNTGKWSGDHLIEADLVPGIILSNKKIRASRPSLTDLAPTILGEFGIPKDETMVGTSIY